jgi:hypothetical protein
LGEGATVTLGAAEGFGEADAEVAGTAVGVGLVSPSDHVFFEYQENAPLARSFSIAAAVRTSPPLKLRSFVVAGSVTVGSSPTGLGSYCSPTIGLISFALK